MILYIMSNHVRSSPGGPAPPSETCSTSWGPILEYTDNQTCWNGLCRAVPCLRAETEGPGHGVFQNVRLVDDWVMEARKEGESKEHGTVTKAVDRRRETSGKMCKSPPRSE